MGIAAEVRGLQVVLLAMALGLAGFTAVVVLLAPLGEAGPETARVLGLLVVGLAVAELPAWLVLRGALLRGAARSAEDPDRLPRELRTLAVVGAALCEGPALMACVAFLLSRQWGLLAAPVLAIGLILALVPTERGVRERLERLRRRRE